MNIFYRIRSCVTIFVYLFQFCFSSCRCSANNSNLGYEGYFDVSNDSSEVDLSVYHRNGVYIIDDTLDLRRKTLYLPADISLVIRKGMLKNGCVVGNNTCLKYRNAVFDRVHIMGTWIVPRISTSMFRNLAYDNSLKDVVALASPHVSNQIHIEEGIYQVTATEHSYRCLNVNSNTKLKIDGTIVLSANDLKIYSILHVSGINISISGKGSLVGDKEDHTGTEGEWGMGIFIAGGENVSIKGLNIKNCWGDCIYIHKNSKNVVIDNCILECGRRQGISITSAQSVVVRNCKIMNISGTNPSFGIDVEPNQSDTVRYVKIEDVEVNNCRGGIECNGRAKDAEIGTITLMNCKISKIKWWPLRFLKAKNIEIEDCQVNDHKKSEVILFNGIAKANVNGIIVDKKKLKRKDEVLRAISREDVKQIRIKQN